MPAAILIALWLGILTSISPCPLATNILAISFIDRKIGKTKTVILTGLLYTVGRMVTYMTIAILVAASILSQTGLSFKLEEIMNKILGPVFIIVGMILLELISFKSFGGGLNEKNHKRAESLGVFGGFFLGVLFALSFCPVSAALFFLSLTPLAVKFNSPIILPAVYGLGTALPVAAFAVLLAIGAKYVSAVYNKVKQLELWSRRITGVIFILAGIYYCLAYIFEIF